MSSSQAVSKAERVASGETQVLVARGVLVETGGEQYLSGIITSIKQTQ